MFNARGDEFNAALDVLIAPLDGVIRAVDESNAGGDVFIASPDDDILCVDEFIVRRDHEVLPSPERLRTCCSCVTEASRMITS